jgi:hypothetical protein
LKKKIYRGFRDAQGNAHVEVNGRPLEWRLDLDNHSPTGLEWGYGGSGPAQLALALIADATGNDERALKQHQDFKWRIVSKLPHDEWQLTRLDIISALHAPFL